MISIILLPASAPHRALHSFPTRRSSDLALGPRRAALRAGVAADGAEPGLGRPTLPGGTPHEEAAADLLEFRQVMWDDPVPALDRKSTRLNSSHVKISYAVFCLKKKNKTT